MAGNETVDFLENIERDFLFGINQRNDFKLKRDFLVFDARRNRRCSSVCDNACIVDVGQRIDGDRDFRAGCDNGFLVVTRENHRPRNHLKFSTRLQGMHNRRQIVAGCDVHIRAVRDICNDLTEINQMSWIDNANWSTRCAG